MKGVEKNGEYKISVSQNDLNIVVDGFKIIPAMGLGSWAAFTACGDSVMVMGDIIVTETDLKPSFIELKWLIRYSRARNGRSMADN